MSQSPPPQNSWTKPAASVAPPQPPPIQTPPPARRPNKVVPAVLWTATVLVVGTTVLYVGALNTPPNIAPPSRPPVPNPNGFDALKAAAAKWTLKDDVGDAIARAPKKKRTPAQKRELVRANGAMISETEAALRLPYLEVNTTNSFTTKLPHLAEFRNLARTLVLAGNVAWDEKQSRLAATRYLDAVTIGRRVPRQTALIGRLVGIACEAIARRPLWERVDKMDEATALYSLNRLTALHGERVPLAVTYAEEAWTMKQMLLEGFRKPDEVAADQADPDESSENVAWGLRTYGAVVPNKYITDAIDGYMDQASAKSKEPYPSSKTPPAPPKELFSKFIVPEIVPLRAKYVGNETGDALLRTALALRVYQLRNGKHPAKLADLVAAKILPAVPDDPFALPGQPLRYKPLPGGKYLLYSIGPDSIDDNGKGIAGKSDAGKTVRYIDAKFKGDAVAGCYEY